MPEIPGQNESFAFGDPENSGRDWRKELPVDTDDDKPLSEKERAMLVAQLGFDPSNAPSREAEKLVVGQPSEKL